VKRGSVTRHSGSPGATRPANGLKILLLSLDDIFHLNSVIGQSLKLKHNCAGNICRHFAAEYRLRMCRYGLKKTACVGMT
jgi:hypothetical protein